MDLTEVFVALGQPRFEELMKGVSMGALKTYQVYEPFKVRARLGKLNRERLRRAVPTLWTRLEEGDQELAQELAQGVLVSNLTMVAEILDLLEIEHDGNGFYEKNSSAAEKLTEGWQKRVLAHFKDKYSESLLLLYINHLDWELAKPSAPFMG